MQKESNILPVGRLDNRTFRSYLNEAYSLCDNLVYDKLEIEIKENKTFFRYSSSSWLSACLP